MNELRVHRSITELQDEYTAGNKKPLEDPMRVWKAIKALPQATPARSSRWAGSTASRSAARAGVAPPTGAATATTATSSSLPGTASIS
jgi:hypothetical protein